MPQFRTNTLDPEVEKLFAAKEARRRRLAALPIHEKVRIVIRLKEMAAPILLARGKNVKPWPIDDDE